MDSVFHEQRQGVLQTYIEDIIISAKTEKENYEKVLQVFEVAKIHGLILKMNKFEFLKRSVTFLGHILGEGRIRTSAEKIEAIRKFSEPSSIKQLQSFLE